MADFFSALGKSRALETIAGTQERAFQTNLAEIQSGSDLLKTGLEIEKFKQTRELNEQNIAANKIELEKAEKQKAFNEKPVPFSIVQDQIERKFPGTSEFLMESAVSFGAVDESGMSSPEKLAQFRDFMLNNDKMGAEFIGLADAQIRKNAEGVRLQIAELRAEKDLAGTSPQMEKLLEQQDAIASQSMEMSELRAQTQIATDAAIDRGEAKDGKPELTQAQTLKRISSIGTARVRLTDGLESGSDTFLKLLPEELQAEIRAGSIKADEAVSRAIAQLDKEERFLREKFLGEASKELTEDELVAAGAEKGSKRSLDEAGNPEFDGRLPVYITPDGSRFVIE